MSDPYADALGLSESSGPSAADWKAASAAQKYGRDSVAILDQEVRQARTPADAAATARTRARVATQVSNTPAPQPANDPYAEALGIGSNPPPADAPAAVAAPRKWYEATPEQQARLDQASNANGGAGTAIAQVGAHAITNAVGSLAGLARAGGAMLGGANLNEASDELERTRDSLTYNPPEGSAGSTLLNALGYPLRALATGTGKLGDATLNATGSPALATVADVGTNALATAGVGKLIAKGVGAPRPAPVAPPRVEPSLSPAPAPAIAPQPVDLTLQPQTAVPAKSAPFPQGVPRQAAETPVSRPAAANAPTISDAPNGVFAESNPDVKGGLPEIDQQRRAQVLQAIGLDNVRKSAITGDSSAAANDFQISRLHESPAGAVMKQTLDGEKAAIQNYAEGITRDTGGSAMNDQSAKLARGGTILAPLDALKDYFDTQTRQLYQVADERAQGVPTQLDNFRTVLGDDSQLTNSDRVHLQSGALAYAKKLGIIGEDGSVFANAQQAETMRKYLNENWSPQNSGFVGKLKDALDDDVTHAAGEDVYSQARAMRAQRATTLDNPNGIANLMDASGPNGINRKVAIEKIPDTVVNMPVSQLQHVVDTLKNAPDEIQPQSQQALAEIKAQIAHNVYDIGSKQAGQWNAKGVRQYLANNSARMKILFSPEEMQRFGTLNDAGNILAKDQSYPGAAAQSHNLLRTGVTSAIQSGSTALGAWIGGPVGGMAGSAMGGKIAGKVNDSASLRSAQKRIVKVSDMLPEKED